MYSIGMETIQEQLKEYIKYERRVTYGVAAEQIGISRQWLSDIINKNAPMGKKAAVLIQNWSNGRLTASELMGL